MRLQDESMSTKIKETENGKCSAASPHYNIQCMCPTWLEYSHCHSSQWVWYTAVSFSFRNSDNHQSKCPFPSCWYVLAQLKCLALFPLLRSGLDALRVLWDRYYSFGRSFCVIKLFFFPSLRESRCIDFSGGHFCFTWSCFGYRWCCFCTVCCAHFETFTLAMIWCSECLLELCLWRLDTMKISIHTPFLENGNPLRGNCIDFCFAFGDWLQNN